MRFHYRCLDHHEKWEVPLSVHIAYSSINFSTTALFSLHSLTLFTLYYALPHEIMMPLLTATLNTTFATKLCLGAVAVAGLTSRISFIFGNPHPKSSFHSRLHLALFLFICFNEYTAGNTYRRIFSNTFILVCTSCIPLLASILAYRINSQERRYFPSASSAKVSKHWHLSKSLGLEIFSVLLRLRYICRRPFVGSGEHVRSTFFMSDPPIRILITIADQA